MRWRDVAGLVIVARTSSCLVPRCMVSSPSARTTSLRNYFRFVAWRIYQIRAMPVDVRTQDQSFIPTSMVDGRNLATAVVHITTAVVYLATTVVHFTTVVVNLATAVVDITTVVATLTTASAGIPRRRRTFDDGRRRYYDGRGKSGDPSSTTSRPARRRFLRRADRPQAGPSQVGSYDGLAVVGSYDGPSTLV